MAIDLTQCGCTDPDNCSCGDVGGGCKNGFCFCTHDGRLEYNERRCHPAFNKTITEGITSMCPIPCRCGCRSSEICREDGKCYCEDGTLVIPLIDENDKLVGHNQTCPPLSNKSIDKTNNVLNHHNITMRSQFSAQAIFISFSTVTLGLIFLILLIGFAVIFIFHKRFKDKLLSSKYFRTTDATRSTNPITRIALESMTENDIYESVQLLSMDTLNLLGSKVIEPDRIKFLKQIGEGNFGKVFKGILTKTSGEQQEVAVKIPRLEVKSQTQLRDFLLEAQITTNFEHENILSCLGISGDSGGAVWLLFEYMPYGDLGQILRSNSGVTSLQRDDLPTLKMADLWWFSLQIARGMQYLADMHYAHRDLAARNCLIGYNLNLKISDFGLTRDIYSNEYYKMSEQRMLPIRWMAPESIQYGKFSTTSDIWSYGILLWEIFSFGKRPYFSYSNQEVAVSLPLGKISPSPPEGSPELLQEIMKSCWNLNPDKRIKFSEIIKKLEEVSMLFFHANPAYGNPLPPIQAQSTIIPSNLSKSNNNLNDDINQSDEEKATTRSLPPDDGNYFKQKSSTIYSNLSSISRSLANLNDNNLQKESNNEDYYNTLY